MTANLFIVGYPKSGTSALWKYLSQHESILACRIKEVYTLCRNHEIGYIGPKRLKVRSLAECRLRYACEYGFRNAEYYLDASPDYITVPGIPHLIKRLAPDAKVLICLREPMSYWRSLHEQWRRMGIFTGMVTLGGDGVDRDGVPAGERMNYLTQIKRFTEVFSSDQLRVVIFEEFKKDNHAYMKRIWRFLNLSPAPIASYSEEKNYGLSVDEKVMVEGRRRLYPEMAALNALLLGGGYVEADLFDSWGYTVTD